MSKEAISYQLSATNQQQSATNTSASSPQSLKKEQLTIKDSLGFVRGFIFV
jgi:hypothetical protein